MSQLFLCRPSTTLTGHDLDALLNWYAFLNVPEPVVNKLRLMVDADMHAQVFMAYWNTLGPDVTMPAQLAGILNGNTSGTRSVGLGVYAAFQAGTGGCQCCIGWRLLVWTGVVAAVAFAVGRLG